MARGVFQNKGDVAVDRVMKFNEHNRIPAKREPSLREQFMNAKVQIEKGKLEKRQREIQREQADDQVKFIQDSPYFTRNI